MRTRSILELPRSAYKREHLQLLWDLWRHRGAPARPWSPSELLPLERALAELSLEATTADADAAAARAFQELQRRTRAFGASFPHIFDPDRNLARLVHAAVVRRRTSQVIEIGVGNGICTSVILEALGPGGRLVSIDLPPVSDPRGTLLGQAVRDELGRRWVLRRGSSRRLLPGVLGEVGVVDLFLSDGANLSGLQLLELGLVWPQLRPGAGIAVFNNVSRKFVEEGSQVAGTRVLLIAQPDKPGAATACLAKS